MMIRNRLFTLAVALLFTCLPALNIKAQNVPYYNATIAAAMDAKFSQLIKKSKVVGASIAVVEHGELVYANGFGFSDLEHGSKVTSETVFPIGSSTKTFTVLAVLQLHEQGLLDINKSIKAYIPELTISSRFSDGNVLRIKDILSHSSGLPSDILNGMMSNETIGIGWCINELNKQSTIAPVGFIDAYSNIGYALLGELIYRVSGLPYADYLQENIFNPLNMKHTTAGNKKEISKGYSKKQETKLTEVRDAGAGCIMSTVLDMSNFLKMLLGDGTFNGVPFVTTETITTMQKDHLNGLLMESSEAYGYGLSIYTAKLTDKDKTIYANMYGHSGYAPPFHADFRYIPEIGVGTVVMTNTRSSSRIRSAGTVLEVYLKETREQDYLLQFKSSDIKNNCKDSDLPGVYNLGAAMLEVKDLSIIKMKIDGQKVILKRKGHSYNYSITAMLLGFIPIKASGLEFRFIKKEGRMYISQKDLDRNREEYVAAKVQSVVIPESWASACGQYEIVKSFSSNDSEFDFANAKVHLKTDGKFIKLEIKTATGGFDFYLNIHSDKLAYTGGMSRQMGYTVKILDNGHLYFSGFEFKLKK